MSSIDNNPWRRLARDMGLPSESPVVAIPDLQGPLLDEVRYSYDQEPFQKWFAAYFAGTSVDPREVYPEWRFNHQAEPDGRSGFTEAGRNSFLCVYGKLRHEGLWSQVRSIRWVGETGEITFFSPQGSAALQQLLLGSGYGDWWLASKNSPWGVRSRFRGAQLHFRGYHSAAEPDNVHIDLHNPGDPPGGKPSGTISELPDAILHFIEDLNNRPQTHTWRSLREALLAQGVSLPPISI